jgi:hypothetical protein
VYAGRDGNVYRKDNGGSWQKYDNGGWNSVPEATPQQREQAAARAQDRAGQAGSQSPTVNQLDRDAAARAEGAQRSRDAATARSPSSSGGTGSYRPSGGASRGGGGRRR